MRYHPVDTAGLKSMAEMYDPDWAKVTGKIKLYGGMNYNVTGPGNPTVQGQPVICKENISTIKSIPAEVVIFAGMC